ncbi:MAG: dipeptide epimerase [Polyangiaceae bacterium]|jgi:L-alanine-DL-glutamate epimerase-like enolase superfamily enzyme
MNNPQHTSFSQEIRIERFEPTPLSVPLIDPFVIATGRIDVTRAVLVTVALRDESSGRRAIGIGEAAAFPPVTREDQPDLLRKLQAVHPVLLEKRFSIGHDLSPIAEWLGALLGDAPVARAGVETALLDALGRLRGVPVRVLLGGAVGGRTKTLVTDVTIPMHEPSYMARLARDWFALGFDHFKIKVGLDRDRDVAAIQAIRDSVPAPLFRLDANGGFTAEDALSLMRDLAALRVVVECFEQPCATDDIEGMAKVAASIAVPVIADESVKTLADAERIQRSAAADGINLKLAKSGGLIDAFTLGRRARNLGLSLMCGGMVETRLGMTAAAHVAAGLGGVEFVDLDTALLLRHDPFRGGYSSEGPRICLSDEAGLGIEHRGKAT